MQQLIPKTNGSTLAEMRKTFIHANQSQYRQIDPDTLLSDQFPTSFTSSAGPNLAAQALLNGNWPHEWNDVYVIQPCLRYWDMENVGDGRHLSLFEMAAVVSVGGDDRGRVLEALFATISNAFAVPNECIWATYYGRGDVHGYAPAPDSFAADYWQQLGIPSEQVVAVDGSEGFVANRHEAVGGYRTELYVATSDECEIDNPKCLPGSCSCGRFIELGTSVSYSFAVDFNRAIPIQLLNEAPVHAAGIGIERALQVFSESNDIFAAEGLLSARDSLLFASGTRNTNKLHHATVAIEHLRAMLFLASENALNLSGRDKKGQRWIVNRYTRHTLNSLESIGLSPREACEISIPQIINLYASQYPYIGQPDAHYCDDIILKLEEVSRMTDK